MLAILSSGFKAHSRDSPWSPATRGSTSNSPDDNTTEPLIVICLSWQLRVGNPLDAAAAWRYDSGPPTVSLALYIASARTVSLDGPARTSFNLPVPVLPANQKGAFIFDRPDHVD